LDANYREPALAPLPGFQTAIRETYGISDPIECESWNSGGPGTAYPDLSIDLILTDAVVDIIAEEIDLAIRLGELSDSRLISTRLMSTRYRACGSPAYLKSAAKLQHPTDLAQHDCLVFPLPGYRSLWRFRRKRGEILEVPIKGAVAISNSLALRRAALDGLGPALLANWLVDGEIRKGNLVELFPGFEVSAQNFDTAAWIVYPSRAYVPRKVRVFIEFLKATVGRAEKRNPSGSSS
jgi:DNA-binding transcriptional LysR family regulator